MSAPADAFTPAEDAQLESATRSWQRRNHLTDTAAPTSAAQFADVLAGTALVQALGWERCLRALTHKTSRRTRSKEAKGGGSSSSSSSSCPAQQGGASAGAGAAAAAASQITPDGDAAEAAAAASLLELHSGGLKRARETVAAGGGGGGSGGGGDTEDDAATVLEGHEGGGGEEEEEEEGEEEEVTDGDNVRAAPPALRAPRYSEGELRKLRRALALPANRPIPGTPQRLAGVVPSPARAIAIEFWERIAASISDTPEPRTAVGVHAKACQLRQLQ
jgi:hypothetical protein